MYKHEDSYLNQLEQRANRLLQDSSSDQQPTLYNKQTLPVYPPTFKSHPPNRNLKTSLYKPSSSPTSSQTLSQTSYSQSRNISFKPKSQKKSSSQNKEVKRLKEYIKELQVQNQILKKNKVDEENKVRNQNKTVEEEMRKFKKEMKGKLQQKFSVEIEVWIKKLKKVEKEKLRQEEEHMREMEEKEREIQIAKEGKKELKKKLSKLNRFILKEMPGISAEIKANSLLIQTCINKYYPK